MATGETKILILGNGPVARTLEGILRGERIQRREDETGWMWPTLKAKSKWPTQVESLRLVLVAKQTQGVSGLIRWHLEARECPLARKVGCVVFGMSQSLATELSNRDVFGRTGDFGESFGNWGEDLAVVDGKPSLIELLHVLNGLIPFYRSAWQRAVNAASPLVILEEGLTRRDVKIVRKSLIALISIDWDAVCSPHPDFENNAHHWANQIRGWLVAVTAGVTPNWEEGISLFTPLLRKSP